MGSVNTTTAAACPMHGRRFGALFMGVAQIALVDVVVAGSTV